MQVRRTCTWGHCGFQSDLALRFPTGSSQPRRPSPLSSSSGACEPFACEPSPQSHEKMMSLTSRTEFSELLIPGRALSCLTLPQVPCSCGVRPQPRHPPKPLPLAQRRTCISRPSTPRLIDGSIPQTATVVPGTSPPSFPARPIRHVVVRVALLPHPVPFSHLCPPSRHRVLCPFSLHFPQTGSPGFCDRLRLVVRPRWGAAWRFEAGPVHLVRGWPADFTFRARDWPDTDPSNTDKYR